MNLGTWAWAGSSHLHAEWCKNQVRIHASPSRRDGPVGRQIIYGMVDSLEHIPTCPFGTTRYERLQNKHSTISLSPTAGDHHAWDHQLTSSTCTLTLSLPSGALNSVSTMRDPPPLHIKAFLHAANDEHLALFPAHPHKHRRPRRPLHHLPALPPQ